MLRDVTKSDRQKVAEAEISAFRDALGPFVTAAETTRMPMMFTSPAPPHHPIVFVNQAFLDMTGYEEHEVLGQSFDALMADGTDPEMLMEIKTAFAGGRGLEPMVRYRLKDNSAIWVTIHIASVRNTEGDISQYFASFISAKPCRNELDGLLIAARDLIDKIENSI